MLDLFHPHLGRYESHSLCEGICPTGARIRFHEVLELRRIDQVVRYDQQALTEDDHLLHTESGVFRPVPGGGLEVALAMNSGRLELGSATWEGSTLRTESRTFFNDRLGVRANARTFRFTGKGCDKELYLATPVWPELTRHMWGRLERVP